MKNLLYSLLAVLTLGCGFTACSDDDADEVINYTTTPEKASAGTYSGTWTRVLATDSVATSSPGEVVFAATDSIGATDITFTCSDFELNATSVANVWNSGRGFQFINNLKSNGLGTEFAGRITEDNKLTVGFTISIREGRATNTYYYSFEGTKQ